MNFLSLSNMYENFHHNLEKKLQEIPGIYNYMKKIAFLSLFDIFHQILIFCRLDIN